jgi:hypothetical protein
LQSGHEDEASLSCPTDRNARDSVGGQGEGVKEPSRGLRDDRTKCRSPVFGKAGVERQRKNRPPPGATVEHRSAREAWKAAPSAAFLLACDLEG